MIDRMNPRGIYDDEEKIAISLSQFYNQQWKVIHTGMITEDTELDHLAEVLRAISPKKKDDNEKNDYNT